MDSNVEEILKKCTSLEAIKNLSDDEKKTLKNQVDKNDRLRSDNGFLGRTERIKFFTFNLPRIITCPGSTTICSEGCYQAISEGMIKSKNRESRVVYTRRLNWFLAEQDEFEQRMLTEILKRRPKAEQKIIIRIHASGDFYSEKYLEKWMKIALAIKIKKKDYEFVAYTKSYSELNNILSNQEKLQNIYEEVANLCGVKLEKKNMLSLSDFNIHIIASYMDDTKDTDKEIAEKWNLPVYFVTKDTEETLTNCEAMPCAKCLKCYTFPMETVVTRLR